MVEYAQPDAESNSGKMLGAPNSWEHDDKRRRRKAEQQALDEIFAYYEGFTPKHTPGDPDCIYCGGEGDCLECDPETQWK